VEKIWFFATFLVGMAILAAIRWRFIGQEGFPLQTLAAQSVNQLTGWAQIIWVLLVLGATFDLTLTVAYLFVVLIPLVAVFTLDRAGVSQARIEAQVQVYRWETDAADRRLNPVPLVAPWVFAVPALLVMGLAFFLLPSPSPELTGWLLGAAAVFQLLASLPIFAILISRLLAPTVGRLLRNAAMVVAIANLAPTAFWIAVAFSARGASGPVIRLALGSIGVEIAVSTTVMVSLLLAAVVVAAAVGVWRRRRCRLSLLESERETAKSLMKIVSIPQRPDFGDRLSSFRRDLGRAHEDFRRSNPIVTWNCDSVEDAHLKAACHSAQLEDPRRRRAGQLDELFRDTSHLVFRIRSGHPSTDIFGHAMALASGLERSIDDAAEEIDRLRKRRLPGAVVLGLIGAGLVGYVVDQAAQLAWSAMTSS
jgi:hypothetical protein